MSRRLIGVGLRQETERKIASQCINDLHNAGYALTVYDGEEETVQRSLDHNEVLGALMTTDEDYLFVHRPGELAHFGWVRFIYGNDGPDVINDYTTNLEDVLTKTMALADEEEKRLYG